MERLDRLIATRVAMAAKGLDAIIITSRTNVFYLSGFTGTSGDLIITLQKAYLLTDFRYIEQAQMQAPDFETVDIKNGFYAQIQLIINEQDINYLGFEDREVTYAVYKGMSENIKAGGLVPLGGLVSEQRRIKYPEEIELLKQAAAITDNAFAHIKTVIRPNITEQDISAEIEFFMRKAGATGTSFDIIVASGERSAMPHGTAGERVIQNGDFIVLDFGCVYKGYCSDITRTVAVGSVSDKQRQVYNIVHYTQLKALNAVKPGAVARDVDDLARRTLKGFDYDRYFGHSLGHGVGVEIHEFPTLSSKNDMGLQEGMVLTIEPGVYIPGEFGVRIEDTVMVTEDGYQVLTHSPKALVIL